MCIFKIPWYYPRAVVAARAMDKKFIAKFVDGLSSIPKSSLHDLN